MTSHAIFAAPLPLLLLVLLARWAFLPARYLPRYRARHLRLRLHLRLHPGRGFATLAGLHWRWGRLAALRRSGRVRPSLPLWERALDPGSHSAFLGRAHLGHQVRVPLEEHVLVIAPPRTYKTAFLADVILRHPGPVIATTTKADVHALTAAVRAGRGPVEVFNPQRIGGVESTFAWSPVQGCEDPAVAIRRADALARSVSQRGVEDASFWAAKASDWMRAYFHAAALAGLDLRDVARWVSGASPGEAEDILIAGGAEDWAQTLAELSGEAERTAATVRMVMSRALSFLADPALAASVLPGPGAGFDITEFLACRGSLYMIADTAGEDAPVAPLFACLAGEIHHAAAMTGQASASRRHDPPLLMGLDEVTQICPVPLPVWLSDSGGKGIEIVAVAHGEAQLAGRWGDHGRQVIWDTSSVKAFLPGITDVRTLESASKLCGQACWKIRGPRYMAPRWTLFGPRYRRARQWHREWRDIATPDMIRQLPPGRALLIRGGLPPVITRLPRAWRNPAYLHARQDAPAARPALPPPDGGDDDGPPPGLPGHVPASLTAGQPAPFPWTRP